ncbi:MAG: Hsp20/alpha crystallin family protein [Chloroflexales bacterium]|nr:Hsp20/alpha crystallin family protein [Chloroflexales bacterium]
MTMLEHFDPVREVVSLRDRINRLFDETFTWPRGEIFPAFREGPAIDMYETEDTVKIKMPLPGVKPEEVEVTVTGNKLMVKGERYSEEEVKEEKFYRHELYYGSFARSITLPEIADAAKAEASFENGILTLNFPKIAEVQPKRIEVKLEKALEAGK